LTPGPSFAHNLGCRCPNGSCEAILDIYTSRPFHWYKEHPNARCFDPLLLSSKGSGVPEDSKSPTLGVWVLSSHLGKVGLRHVNMKLKLPVWINQNRGLYMLVLNLLPSNVTLCDSFKNFKLLEQFGWWHNRGKVFDKTPIKLCHSIKNLDLLGGRMYLHVY
jgi:hypothetical protein